MGFEEIYEKYKTWRGYAIIDQTIDPKEFAEIVNSSETILSISSIKNEQDNNIYGTSPRYLMFRKTSNNKTLDIVLKTDLKNDSDLWKNIFKYLKIKNLNFEKNIVWLSTGTRETDKTEKINIINKNELFSYLLLDHYSLYLPKEYTTETCQNLVKEYLKDQNNKKIIGRLENYQNVKEYLDMFLEFNILISKRKRLRTPFYLKH